MAKVTPKDADNAVDRITNNDEMRWKAESAMRTMMEADAHRKDPEMMKAVKKMAAEKTKQMSELCK